MTPLFGKQIEAYLDPSDNFRETGSEESFKGKKITLHLQLSKLLSMQSVHYTTQTDCLFCDKHFF